MIRLRICSIQMLGLVKHCKLQSKELNGRSSAHNYDISSAVPLSNTEIEGQTRRNSVLSS